MTDQLEVLEDVTERGLLLAAPAPPENIKLPADPQKEAAVISLALRSAWALDVCVSLVPIEAFSSPRHRKLWRAVVSLRAAGETPDVVTVRGWLDDRRQLTRDERGGDEAYLNRLLTSPGHETLAEEYARSVVHTHARRCMILALQRALTEANSNPEKDVFAKVEREVLAATRATSHKKTLGPIKEAIVALAGKFGDGSVELPLVPTGVGDLDHRIKGLRRGQLTVLAGRPGMGKSAIVGGICVTAAEHVSSAEASAVLVMSAEMTKEEIASRLLAAEAVVDADRVLDGQCVEDKGIAGGEYNRIFDAAAHLSKLPIWIDDRAAPTMDDVLAAVREVKWECERIVRDDGLPTFLRLVVIDHLHIMKTKEDAKKNRERAIAEITGASKQLAKDEDVAVVLLAQLNRSVESRQNKRPVQSDLRDSGSIEQDADAIFFLYRDAYYDPDSPMKEVAEIIIAKRRGGAAGSQNEVALAMFEGKFTRFRDLTPSEFQELAEERRHAPAPQPRGRTSPYEARRPL